MKTSIIKSITVLVRNNNTFDTIYEWYGYDAGCFKAYAFFLFHVFANINRNSMYTFMYNITFIDKIQ